MPEELTISKITKDKDGITIHFPEGHSYGYHTVAAMKEDIMEVDPDKLFRDVMQEILRIDPDLINLPSHKNGRWTRRAPLKG